MSGTSEKIFIYKSKEICSVFGFKNIKTITFLASRSTKANTLYTVSLN